MYFVHVNFYKVELQSCNQIHCVLIPEVYTYNVGLSHLKSNGSVVSQKIT